MTRFRITVRGEGPALELRGYADLPIPVLNSMASALQPYGIVVASVADDDYNPFKEERDRELHHFEVEQENERLRRSSDTYTLADLDGTPDEADWLQPGHVLDAQEVDWLRSRRITRE